MRPAPKPRYSRPRVDPHREVEHGLCAKCNAFGQVLEFLVPDGKFFRTSEAAVQAFDQGLVDYRTKPFHLCRDCTYPNEKLAREAEVAQTIKHQELMRELATVLHESRCLGPHEGNGCSFPKEEDWSLPSRREWLRRAQETLDSMPSADIEQVIRVLKST